MWIKTNDCYINTKNIKIIEKNIVETNDNLFELTICCIFDKNSYTNIVYICFNDHEKAKKALEHIDNVITDNIMLENSIWFVEQTIDYINQTFK